MTIEEMIELAKKQPDHYEIRTYYIIKMLTNPYKGIYIEQVYENGILINSREIPEGPIMIPSLLWI